MRVPTPRAEGVEVGHVRHHAIVVTSWEDDLIERAHGVAEAGGCEPTPISESMVNGYRSFLVPPDGSKSGWSHDREGDERRDRFKEFLRSRRYYDGSSSIEWVEVAYGSDDAGNDISPFVSDHEWVDDPHFAAEEAAGE
jgi:hypothetical protein